MREETKSLALPSNGTKNNGRFFYGRETLFSAVQMDLQASLARPLVLFGDVGFGKTAVLQQIAAGRLGSAYSPLFIDLAQLANSSLSRFWWNFSRAGLVALQAHAIQLPPLPQESFITTPFNAFQTYFIQPLLAQSNGRIPLFLFDNVDEFCVQLAKGKSGPNLDLVEQLARFFHDPMMGTLVALEKSPESLPPVLAPLLDDANSYVVGALDSELSCSLLAANAGWRVPGDVGTYVQGLTAGQPAALQQLRHALVDQPNITQRRQLTVADIVAVYREQAKSDLATAVTPFTFDPPQSGQIGFGNSRFLRWSVVVLLILFVPLSLFFWFTRPAQPELSAATMPIIVENKKPTAVVEGTKIPSSPVPTAAGLPGGSVDRETAVVQTPVTQLTTTPFADDKPSNIGMAPVITREIDAMPMLFIPAGTFLMGSVEGDFIAAADEFPQQKVTLKSFYMDKYEVSAAQYASFLNQLDSYLNACDGEDCFLPRSRAGNTSYIQEEDLGAGQVQYIPLTGYANFPVNFVNWFGAKAYCEYVGGRLPTEAEWEYAARGTDGRLYPWGNDPPGQGLAVFQSTFDELKPVDALPAGASPFGIFGMAGSMWEWTADWYAEDQYELGIQENLTGPETGFMRVLRGGAWPENNEADRIRTANRHSMEPTFFSGAAGFRCVFNPDEAANS